MPIATRPCIAFIDFPNIDNRPGIMNYCVRMEHEFDTISPSFGPVLAQFANAGHAEAFAKALAVASGGNAMGWTWH